MRKTLSSIGLVVSIVLPSFASAASVPHVNREIKPTVVTSVKTLPRLSPRALQQQAQAAANARALARTKSESPLTGTYGNADYHLNIQYPNTWQMQELKQKEENLTLLVMFLSPLAPGDTIRENINLVIEDISKNPLTLDDYTTSGLEKERKFFDSFKIIESINTTLAALPAHSVTYTASLKGQTLEFRQVWVLRGKEAHVWTFADTPANFDKDVSVFMRMLGTLTMN